jgi:hypothetical protein
MRTVEFAIAVILLAVAALIALQTSGVDVLFDRLRIGFTALQ